MEYQRPKIDPRTREDIANEIAQRIAAKTGWQPDPERPDGISALVDVASVLADDVRLGLEASLGRHELEFLDLIGTQARPADAARLPVTFVAAPGAGTSVVVPPVTKVVAASSEAPDGQVVFETTTPVALTTVAPRWALLHDVQSSAVLDVGDVLTGVGSADVAQLRTPHPPEPVRLYVGCAEPGSAQDAAKQPLAISVTLGASDPEMFNEWTWEQHSDTGWGPLATAVEFTATSPDVWTYTYTFTADEMSATEIDGVKAVWLRASVLASPPADALTIAAVDAAQGDGSIVSTLVEEYGERRQIPTLPLSLQTTADASTSSGVELCVGFDEFPATPALSLFVELDDPRPEEVTPERMATAGELVRTMTCSVSQHAGSWQHVQPEDGTNTLGRSGVITIPTDLIEQRVHLGRLGWWVALSVDPAMFASPTRVAQISANTVWATEGESMVAEIVGSGEDAFSQQITTAHHPVLPGQQLMVTEDDDGPPIEWHQVDDYTTSGPHDRHYIIDHRSGRVTFGDGTRGRTVPRGVNNITMRYRTGGGVIGNIAAGSELSLMASLPAVAAVQARHAGRGGTEVQPVEEILRLGPRSLRHRGRAVTAVDYSDIVHERFPEVARLKAFSAGFDEPGRLPTDLFLDAPPPENHVLWNTRSVVGLAILPRRMDPQPVPSLDLIERIRAELGTVAPLGTTVWVAGPTWRPVSVSVGVIPESVVVSGGLTQRVEAVLRDFLHPVSGAADGRGWAFGRLPHESDLYRAILDVEGVDALAQFSLQMHIDGGPDDGTVRPSDIIHAGTITVNLQ